MEAKELRIGNVVRARKFDDADWLEQCVIDGINIDGINLYWSYSGIETYAIWKNIEGIPLTIEWLKKWGFNFDYESEEYPNANKDFGRYNIVVETEQMGVHVYNESHSDTLFLMYARTDYVHEFQNLIFALTNTELETK